MDEDYRNFEELDKLLQSEPALKGSEKQVSWARELYRIRSGEVQMLINNQLDKARRERKDVEVRKRYLAQRYLMSWKWLVRQDASFWIRWRGRELADLLRWGSKQHRQEKELEAFGRRCMQWNDG